MDDFFIITATDANGALIGPEDPADWSRDSLWTEAERRLIEIDGMDEAQGPGFELSPAYPNPTSGSFSLSLRTPSTEGLELRLALVNERFEPLRFTAGKNSLWIRTLPSGGSHAISLDLTGLENFQPNASCRLYYALVGDQLVWYKGRGDIRLAP